MLRGAMWASIEPVWQAAIAEAWAAYAAGSHAIGAVVTAPDGTIVARGRNRTRDAEPTIGQLHGSRLAHAEMNALYALPKDADPLSLTLWTTHEPCPLCASHSSAVCCHAWRSTGGRRQRGEPAPPSRCFSSQGCYVFGLPRHSVARSMAIQGGS